MAPVPDWKRVLDTGVSFTELRRSQARKLAADLVAQGQLARNQVGAAVDELVEASRRRSEELRSVVRAEVERQLGVIGIATKSDLEALERRLRNAKPAKATAKGAGTKPGAKATAKASAAKRAPAKKSASKTTKPAAAKRAASAR